MPLEFMPFGAVLSLLERIVPQQMAANSYTPFSEIGKEDDSKDQHGYGVIISW